MPLRLIEVVVPRGRGDEAQEVAGGHPVVDCWREEVDGDRVRLGVLVDAGATEPLLDELQQRFGAEEGFRAVLMAVEASVPRPEAPGGEGEEEEEDAGGGEEEGEAPPPSRISREELYADLSETARLSPVFAVMTALSAVVCAFGLMMDDVAVVIGAMVIAPILGPLVALSLATTLADADLARDGLRTGLGGLGLALVLSLAVGVAAPVDPDVPAIAARSSVGLGHLGLALAAGAAGTLAFTTGTAAAVIGVMVAVALVPPLVAAGLLLGDGHLVQARGALLLTLVNFISVNLAGVVTFLAQGVRPHRWWEAERARRATWTAMAVWSLLLAVLAAVILWGP